MVKRMLFNLTFIPEWAILKLMLSAVNLFMCFMRDVGLVK